MNLDLVWIPRTITNQHWATYLWIICMLCLLIAKFISESRFYEFLSIFSNDKYIKSNRENKAFVNWFLVVLYLLNLIVVSFLVLIFADYWSVANKNDSTHFLKIFTIISAFLISKTLIEKIIATSFDIEEIASNYKFHKVSYQNYSSVLLLPFTAMLYYAEEIHLFWILLIGVFTLFLNGYSYIRSTQLHQSWLFSRMFYFILYLCALEIAPYYFMFYWFKKI